MIYYLEVEEVYTPTMTQREKLNKYDFDAGRRCWFCGAKKKAKQVKEVINVEYNIYL